MHFTQVRAGETPQLSKLKVTANILGVSVHHTEFNNPPQSTTSKPTKLYTEMIRGFYSWVLCPVHGHEIQFIRERQAAFYTRCSWWVEMDLNAASLDKN